MTLQLNRLVATTQQKKRPKDICTNIDEYAKSQKPGSKAVTGSIDRKFWNWQNYRDNSSTLQQIQIGSLTTKRQPERVCGERGKYFILIVVLVV